MVKEEQAPGGGRKKGRNLKHALIPEDWGETLELDSKDVKPEEYVVEEHIKPSIPEVLPPKRRSGSVVIPSRLTPHITDFFGKLSKVVGGGDKEVEQDWLGEQEEQSWFERMTLDYVGCVGTRSSILPSPASEEDDM